MTTWMGDSHKVLPLSEEQLMTTERRISQSSLGMSLLYMTESQGLNHRHLWATLNEFSGLSLQIYIIYDIHNVYYITYI